jgi:hypothetical protein
MKINHLNNNINIKLILVLFLNNRKFYANIKLSKLRTTLMLF